MSKKKKEWRAEKERLLSLGLEERRKEYGVQHVTLDNIPTWREFNSSSAPERENPVSFCDKVSLYKGDITSLEVDAIVNAANSSLLGGGGVDGCIHRAAGHFLYDECHSLNGCETGKAKITCGYDLPAKYVIHTVGPIARGTLGQSQRDALKSCYNTSLKLVKDHDLRSVAFPCISTGIYGFPNEPAADIALNTVKDWLKENKDKIDRIIFCVFLENDYGIYKRKMSEYFSPEKEEHEEASAAQAEDDAKINDAEDVDMMSQRETEAATYESDVEMSQENLDADMIVDTASQEPENDILAAEKDGAKEAAVEDSVPDEEEAAGGSKPKEEKEEEPVEGKEEKEDGAGAEKETVAEAKPQNPPAETKEEDDDQTKNKESQGLKECTEPKGASSEEPNAATESNIKDDLDDDSRHQDGDPEEPNQVPNGDNLQSKDVPTDKSEPKE